MNLDQNRKNLLFNTIVYSLLIIMALVVVVPFLFTISASFATEKELLTRGFFLFPREWTLDAYMYLIHNNKFLQAFSNAIILTVIGTTINMVLTTLMAYGLSHTEVKGRKTINFLVLFTILFHGGMIPTYLVVHYLGLIDSYWSIWLVTAITPFNLIIIRSFFRTLPGEIKESARIDGCGEWRLLWSIILPLSMAVLVTFTLFYTVTNWNTYFHAILYLNDSSKYPLQVFLREMLIVNTSDFEGAVSGGRYQYTPAVQNAAILLTALPLLLVYPFLQKYFDKGMFLGSVKG